MSETAASPASRAGATRAAHNRSVAMGVAGMASALQAQLGQAVLRIVFGAEAKALSRWANATVRPPRESETLLRDTSHVVEVLTSVDSPAVARAWFMRRNPRLDDASPAEALSKGRAREVLAAARSYADPWRSRRRFP